MSGSTLHQALVGVNPHDAITDQAFLMRRWLREAGYRSEIYAYYIHDELLSEVKSLLTYRPTAAEKHLIWHHSIGSSAVDLVLEQPLPLIMVYHNITPAEFFTGIDPFWAATMAQGRAQLTPLRDKTALGLADSAYNELELRELGYGATAVVPITFDPAEYDIPLDEQLAADLRQNGPLFLFVGRLTPNKKQEDLLKFFYYYRRIEPSARLAIVGDYWLPGYVNWLRAFADLLDLGDAISLPGRVSHQQLVTYYRTADLYLSMSEHEGFGKPYIESMYAGLPVMAYAAASTPYVLGDAGVLFYRKEYPLLAETAYLLLQDRELHGRLAVRQKAHLTQFSEPASRIAFWQALATIGYQT
jgi:glycosyltransferase involved in cell wall biosynthesis